VDDLVGSRVRHTLFAYQAVAVAAQPINFRQHPRQEFVGRPGGNAGPLEVTDFILLPRDLAAHKLDFLPDAI
jgi:hypothetical protein